MNSPSYSILGLVELSDDHVNSGFHASANLHLLHDAFQDRLSKWVRAKDQWRLLENNRVCVILKDISSEGELELAAAKLERVFKDPHEHMGKKLSFKVNAGFAQFDISTKDMTLPMEQAGIALSQAKQSANLFEVYSPQNGSDWEAERTLLDELEAALELGELELYYQPKVHAGFRSLIGAEALIRWNHQAGKVIMPDKFIDVAEKNDIIGPMTWWTIKTAVGQLARWPQELSISVNVSPSLLLGNDILTVVHDALDIYDVTPTRLNLEVTEKIMVDNQALMLSQLSRLRNIGVKISLDDFGTGFSSLSYFRDLPVDEIKIDQSFVLGMLKSKKDLAIVKAVIDLAHNFSMTVVAEGVETFALADRLSEMRCDILQGYVFDKPLPVERFNQQYSL